MSRLQDLHCVGVVRSESESCRGSNGAWRTRYASPHQWGKQWNRCASPFSEVKRRRCQVERPGFRTNELQISPTQKMPLHSYSNVQDTFCKEGISGQPTERRESKWRKGLALSLRMDIAG